MKKQLFLVCWIVLLLILSGVVRSNGLAAGKVKLAIPFPTPTYKLPLIAADEKGIWTKNGVEVEWSYLRGATRVFRAMAAGSVEIAWVHIIGLIQAASSGVPVVAVASTGQMMDWSMWVRADSPFKDLKDLRGEKVGVSKFGGTSDAYTKVVLKALGLEKDIRVVAIGGLRTRIASLKTGAISGFFVGNVSMVELRFKGEVRGIGSLLSFLPRPWETETVNSHKNLVAKKPAVVKSIVRAILQAGDFIRADKEWSIEKLKTALRFSERAAPAVFKIVIDSHRTTYGKIDPQAVANVRNFLIDHGLISKERAAEVRDLYTNAFVPSR